MAHAWSALGAGLAALALCAAPGGRSLAATGARPYLLAFHACDTARADCTDFRNHLAYIAESDGGTRWSVPAGFVPAPGSVPDVVRRGTSVYR